MTTTKTKKKKEKERKKWDSIQSQYGAHQKNRKLQFITQAEETIDSCCRILSFAKGRRQ
jgi:hypothetical protein